MNQILETYPETAVNCLTGCYAALTTALGHPTAEQLIFEQGGGYLFQAGLDEAGYPEYIFPVEEAGALGMRSCGFAVSITPIDNSNIAVQLQELLTEHPGVIVWVNTAHLAYAETYADSAGYLHAVLIESIASDHSFVTVLDTLVVGAKPFSCRATLSLKAFTLAVSDRIHSETHDGMGIYYTATQADETDRTQLDTQAQRFFKEDRFRLAIPRYRQLCTECFESSKERAAIGARRLFHHATALYAVPSLTLMGKSLRDARASADTLALHDTVLRHWRAMGVLALRYEATFAPSVLSRISQRFTDIDEVTTNLWAAIRDDPWTKPRHFAE